MPRSTSTTTGSPRPIGEVWSQVKNAFRLPLNRTSSNSGNSALGKLSHFEVLLRALPDQLVRRQALQVPEVYLQGVSQSPGRLLGIGMCAARRPGNDFVDDAQLVMVAGGQLPRFGRALLLRGV